MKNDYVSRSHFFFTHPVFVFAASTSLRIVLLILGAGVVMLVGSGAVVADLGNEAALDREFLQMEDLDICSCW